MTKYKKVLSFFLKIKALYKQKRIFAAGKESKLSL